MMPNAGMMPAAYGMPAMYNLQPVCHNIFSISYLLAATIWNLFHDLHEY